MFQTKKDPIQYTEKNRYKNIFSLVQGSSDISSPFVCQLTQIPNLAPGPGVNVSWTAFGVHTSPSSLVIMPFDIISMSAFEFGTASSQEFLVVLAWSHFFFDSKTVQCGHELVVANLAVTFGFDFGESDVDVGSGDFLIQ